MILLPALGWMVAARLVRRPVASAVLDLGGWLLVVAAAWAVYAECVTA